MPDPLVPDTARPNRPSVRSLEEVVELLAFVCDDELYAVDLRAVHEIVIPPPITLVPRSPPAVVGVCSVRGQLATVVDLRVVLNLPPTKDESKSRILLAKMGESDLVGLRVDEVRHVVRLSMSQIEFSAQTLGGDVSDGVRGIGRPHGGEVIVLLDLISMLNKGCS